MSPEPGLVGAVDAGDPSTPALAAVGSALCLGPALCYVLLRAGYLGGSVAAGAYGTLTSGLFWGSLLLGVGAAAASGFGGATAPAGVLAGGAPAIGVVAGSAVSVGAGLGSYDASPAALGVGLLAAWGALCVVAWVGGRAARRAAI